MAASSTNADSNLDDGDKRKSETNVEGKQSYPLYFDRTSHSFIKGNSPDNARIERCLFRPKLHFILVYNNQSSLSVV